MYKQSFETTIEVIHTVKVEVTPIPNSRNSIYRYTERVRRKGSEDTLIRHEGLAAPSQLAKLRKGLVATTKRICVMSDDDIAGINQFGYSSIRRNDYAATNDDKAFTYLENGGEMKNLVELNNYDHRFRNVNGKNIVSGIRFDYTDGLIHNKNYRLKKLVEILKARDDVVIVDPEDHDFSPVDEGEEITDIPYYNRDGGRERTVSFYWKPSRQQYARLAKLGSFERYEAIFDQDMLGLRAGGAAKREKYYE